MLPEVKMRIEAQAAAGDHGDEHLNAIQVAAEKRSRKLMMNLKRELSSMFKKSNVALEQQVRTILLIAPCCSEGQSGLSNLDLTRNNLLSSSAALTPTAMVLSRRTNSARAS